MAQLLGIIALVACIAVLVLVPGREWPRAPTWMRTTALATALGLAILGVVIFLAARNSHDGPGGLVLVVFAGGALLVALRLVAWACVGRLNPRSIWAAMSRDARSTPRRRSR